MAFERAARMEDLLDGRGRAVELAGRPVALFRVGDEVYAIEDRCPHADAPLSGGTLSGCVVVCPLHGWDFDVRTGFKPGDPDGFPIPRYAVRVESGEVFVDVEDELNHPRRRKARVSAP